MALLFFLLIPIVSALFTVTGEDIKVCSTSDSASCLPSAGSAALAAHAAPREEEQEVEDEDDADLILHMQMRVQVENPLGVHDSHLPAKKVQEVQEASKGQVPPAQQVPVSATPPLETPSADIPNASRHQQAPVAEIDSGKSTGTYPLLAQVWKQAPMLVILAGAGIFTAILAIFGLLAVGASRLMKKREVVAGKVVETPLVKGWITTKLTDELQAIKLRLNKSPPVEDSDNDSAMTDEEEPEAESESEQGEIMMSALRFAAKVEEENEAVDVEYAARTAHLYC